MASNISNTFDLLVKCDLCNGELDNNQPKSLPCLHTFCSPCLRNKRHRFVQDADIFKCPVCHTSVSLSEDLDITTNLKLDVIIEKLIHVHKLQKSKRHYCDMCRGVETTGASSAATHWCQDCGKFLCNSCLVHHRTYKPYDEVIDVSQGVDNDKVGAFILPTKCSRHGKRFNMYCVQCKMCLCSDCLIDHRSDTNASSSCVPVSIENVARDTKSQGRQILKETHSHLARERQQIEGTSLNIGDLRRQLSEKTDEIWEHMEETVRRLRENARVLIAELEAETKSKVNELEKLIQLRQGHVKEIEIIDNNFRQLLKSFDNVDIILHSSRLKSKCENLLKKSNEDVPSTVLNMEYNNWYKKTHEMSENVPMGRCWWKNKRLTTKLGIEVPPRVSLRPPVPYLGNKYGDFIDENWHDVSCIFVTDEKHVLVGSGAYGKLYEYNEADTLCAVHKPRGMRFCSDLCYFSSDKICIVDGSLILMKMNKNAPLAFFKRIKPDVPYYSMCNCFGNILVCDYDCRVHLLSESGTVRRTVVGIKRGQSLEHKLRCGPFKDTFLLHNYNNKKGGLFCYNMDGECLFSFKFGGLCDLCTDKYGNIYAANTSEIYVLSPCETLEKHQLFSVEGQAHRPRIFIKDDIFYFASDQTGAFQLEKFPLHHHERSL